VFDHESFSQEQFVWLLGAACQLHRVPFDPQLVLQQFPPPHTLAAARQALEDLGFRSGLTETLPEAFAGLALPCFALIRTGSGCARARC
jgi:ATP-binding cassette, subfamily B, bacterial HlyB/CyaB